MRRCPLLLLISFVLVSVLCSCGPSEEEKRLLAEKGGLLVGKWKGGEHTFEFRRDGTFEHEEVTQKGYVYSIVSRRKGTWEVRRIEGSALCVSLRCRSRDTAGYWVQKDRDAINTWSVYFEPRAGRLRYNGSFAKSSPWIVLEPVKEKRE